MAGDFNVLERFSPIEPHLKGEELHQAKQRGLFRIAGRLRQIVKLSPLTSAFRQSRQESIHEGLPIPENKSIRQRRGHVQRKGRLPSLHKPVVIQPGDANKRALEFHASVSNAAGKYGNNGTIPKDLITTQRNAVESVAIGGEEIFGSFASVIKSARDEVLIQTFSWEPNSPGVQDHIIPAIKALQAEARAHPERFSLPLKIRILVNQARGPAAKFMKRKKGNRAPTVENLLPNLGKVNRQLLDIKGGIHINKLTDGLHTKTVVADGTRAAITGANVQKRNHANTERNGLAAYDTGTVVRGEVGQSLRAGFIHNWENGLDAKDKPNKKIRPQRRPPNFNLDHSLTNTPITVLTRKANPNISKRSLYSPQSQGLITAIRESRDKICIQSPNLNNPELIKELVGAAKRNVKVEILLSKRFNEQRESTVGAGGTNTEAVGKLKLLSNNHPNLDIRWYVAPGGTTPVEENLLGDGASHAKFASFDDQMVVIGSANMDNQSWYYADETSLAIAGKDNTLYVKNRLFQPAFDRSVSA